MNPKVIHSVSGLSLLTRMIVDGGNSGIQHSRSLGQGMEFSQYRGYEPGDDLRLLDWKMLARSGRYYIKQGEVESNINVRFILDASNSMLHTADGLSKMDYSRVLIAALAYLCQKQGDAFGLFALNEKQVYTLFPKAHKQHYNRFLLELITIENLGKWPQNPSNIENIHDRSKKELLVFITDLYEHDGELLNFIKSLKTTRNEVLVIQIMAKNEMELSYKGSVILEDLETGSRVAVNADQAKAGYLDNLRETLQSVRKELLSTGIAYHRFVMDDDPGTALQLFLKTRTRFL